MEIPLNELSLTGQFNNQNDFLENIDKLLPIFQIIKNKSFFILREYSFFNSQVTSNQSLNNVIHSRDDRIRKLKSFLSTLSAPPYWNDSRKHNCHIDNYSFDGKCICDTSLAEASQRDKIILSFDHDDYQRKQLIVKKNNIDINIFNIIDKVSFLEKLYQDKLISELEFCLFKFKNSKINFTTLEEKYGFNLLNQNQTREFINSFNVFSSMSWLDIEKSDGLEYKSYTGSWFNSYADKNIKKFRASQRYRCFGYRSQDVFYVLRFETDHKISDDG